MLVQHVVLVMAVIAIAMAAATNLLTLLQELIVSALLADQAEVVVQSRTGLELVLPFHTHPFR
jgi:hypothetical protein